MSQNLTGALFKVKKKRKETDSDYNGSVTVNGVDYWLNGRIATPKKGGPAYVRLSLQAKKQEQQQGEQQPEKKKPTLAPPPFPDAESSNNERQTEGADRPLDPIDPNTGEYHWEGDKQ